MKIGWWNIRGFSKALKHKVAHTRAEKARKELKQQQLLLHDNPWDVQLKESVAKQQKQTVVLSDVERKFCAQKTKIDFLLNGDKFSKLFHYLIKRKAKKNFIPSLQREDGTTTMSTKEVQEEFLNFYKGLLGTKEETDPFLDNVMEEGPTISQFQGNQLTADFTATEIKAALFDVGNEKSPRPDVENIHLAQELMRGYSRKRTTPKCTLKIDIRKAYDIVSWGFLHRVLLALNFPIKFVEWIMECACSPSYSLKINGGIFGYFKEERGLR
ncbi:hypothetical protein M9H77_30017 [Catharanthus roseus]|uniref:Uncharacterized protein n=1 Tax=Catharanthus roseus TaxID=4058 RepID=A0ACB9ZX38_CATRO|nr:hypothetical protein M9H77_30017 [Catharanthus roseus]